MASLGMILLSYMLVLGHAWLLVQGHELATPSPNTSGHAAPLPEHLQDPPAWGNGTEGLFSEDETELSLELEEGRNFEITPSLYTNMFGNSLLSIKGAIVLLASNNGTTVQDFYKRHSYLVSMAVSTLAAFCSGIAAIISIIVVPLRVVNQILAVIALALLAVYIVEDKHSLSHLVGFDSQFLRTPVYSSSYAYAGPSSQYRIDILEEDTNEPGLGEEEVRKENGEKDEGEKDHETKQNNTLISYNENANSVHDLLKENNRIDEAEREVAFAFRKYYSQYDQRGE